MRPRLLALMMALVPLPLLAADIQVTVTPNRAAAVNGVLPVTITVANADRPVDLRLLAHGAATLFEAFSGAGWTCDPQPQGSQFVTCHSSGAGTTLTGNVRFPAQYGRSTLDVSVTNPAPVFGQAAVAFAEVLIYRTFNVTTSADDGPGSLRDAIRALNGDVVCGTLPCGIEFDLPANAPIVLASPLEVFFAADVTVDGTTHAGAPVTIRGSGGNGLDFAARFVTVRGLTLSGFADNALLIRPQSPQTNAFIEHNTLEGNLRGLNVTPGFISARISDNEFRNNARSGVFVDTLQSPGVLLAPSMTFTRNRFTGNGTSGVYLGPHVDGALFSGNTFSGNHDFGLAVARGARIVRVMDDTFTDNGWPIDIGLDGPTLGTIVGSPLDTVPAPVLETATYDAATNTTTIAGETAATFGGFVRYDVELWVNDRAEHGDFTEAQQYLGMATAAAPTGFTTVVPFTFTAFGDLRGKFISALSLRTVNLDGSLLYSTSEFGRMLPVH